MTCYLLSITGLEPRVALVWIMSSTTQKCGDKDEEVRSVGMTHLVANGLDYCTDNLYFSSITEEEKQETSPLTSDERREKEHGTKENTLPDDRPKLSCRRRNKAVKTVIVGSDHRNHLQLNRGRWSRGQWVHDPVIEG